MKSGHGVIVPIILGMLTAFGPFITDFYLPVLPEMTIYFNTSISQIAMSITTALLGLSLGQILVGPLTDKYGRKPILIFCLCLFCVSTVLCIFAHNILIFNILRVLQGVGGAGGIAIPKSMSTDMYRGKDLASFMALLVAINNVAPIIAPVVGGTVAQFSSWKGVFLLLLMVGLFLLFGSLSLEETLPKEKRNNMSVWNAYKGLVRVLRNPIYALAAFSFMGCSFAFFSYIASSSFILQEVYGLTSFQFSLCFGLIGIMISFGATLSRRFKEEKKGLYSSAVHFSFGCLFVAITLLLHLPFPVLMIAYSYMMFSFGLFAPMVTSVAMDSERENAGAASALFGALSFLAGGISSPIVSVGDISIASSMVMLVGTSICIFFVTCLCRRLKKG